MKSQSLCQQLSEFLKMHWEQEFAKVFLHDNCEQISFIIFFAFQKKDEMRSGTHFTQQNVLLLFTVVVTKTRLAIFSVPFPQTSSERVSSTTPSWTMPQREQSSL